MARGACQWKLHLWGQDSLLLFLNFHIFIERFSITLDNLIISLSCILCMDSCEWLCEFTSLIAQLVKNLPAMKETWVRFLGWEDPLEKEMATHSSILAWRIPWTEEPGGLRSMGSQEPDRTEWPAPLPPAEKASRWWCTVSGRDSFGFLCVKKEEEKEKP